MDARLDPAKFAGLAEGDAHVIRNAGGRASDDAIPSGKLLEVAAPEKAGAAGA
jgi:carbonic anhydrase